MTNTDRQHTVEQRAAILQKFCQKMRDSGYESSTRCKILISAITKYYRLVKEDLTGTSPLHRSAKEVVGKRRLKKFKGRKWFDIRKRGGTNKREHKENPHEKPHTRTEIGAYNRGKTVKHRSKSSISKDKSGFSHHTDPKATMVAISTSTDDNKHTPMVVGGDMERTTETVVFVPHTAYSRL